MKLERAPLKFHTKLSNDTPQNIHYTDFYFLYGLRYLWIVTSYALVRRAPDTMDYIYIQSKSVMWDMSRYLYKIYIYGKLKNHEAILNVRLESFIIPMYVVCSKPNKQHKTRISRFSTTSCAGNNNSEVPCPILCFEQIRLYTIFLLIQIQYFHQDKLLYHVMAQPFVIYCYRH